MTPVHLLKRVFVASRGLSALRVVRAAHASGVEAVVLVREIDAESAWPDEADYAVYVSDVEGQPWPALESVVASAMDAGCDAVHPSWGPLARTPLLPEAQQLANLTGPGPTMVQLAAASDRTILRLLAEQLEIPVVPGSDPIDDLTEAETWLSWTGLPAVVKPVDESSGIGARLIEPGAAGRLTLEEALANGPVVLERLVERAREIEVPFVGDGTGKVLTLSHRDITLRLLGQRTLVEAPAPSLDATCQEEIRTFTLEVAQHLKWLGLGAARFLVTPDGRPYFLQLRPGLQPWDCATETLLGIDLADAQLRIAGGEPMLWSADDIVPRGHTLCLRLVAGPEGGVLHQVSWPAGVRVEKGPCAGDPVAPGDELGLVVVTAPTRQAAIVRLKGAVDTLVLSGVRTNLSEFRRLVDDQAFWQGPLDRDQAAALLESSAWR